MTRRLTCAGGVAVYSKPYACGVLMSFRPVLPADSVMCLLPALVREDQPSCTCTRAAVYTSVASQWHENFVPLATQGMAAFSCLYMIGCPCHVCKVPTSSLSEAHVFVFSCAQILCSIDGWYEITGSLRRGGSTEIPYGAKLCSRWNRRTVCSRQTRCFESSLTKYRSSVRRHR